MISKDKGELLVECDGCGSTEYAGTLDFYDFVNWLKEQGWKTSKDGDVWVHECPDCREF